MIERAADRARVHAAGDDDMPEHSDELGAMLGAIPHWTIRSGQGYLCACAALAVLLAWIIRYPDTVQTVVRLRAEQPPASVVARSSGYVVLHVADGATVAVGEYLGHVTSSANADRVLELEDSVRAFASRFRERASADGRCRFDGRRFDAASLGEIESAYDAFVVGVRMCDQERERRTIVRRRVGLTAQRDEQQHMLDQARQTALIEREQLSFARARHDMDSAQYVSHILSPLDYVERQRSYLASQADDAAAMSGVAAARLALASLDDRIRETSDDEERQRRDDARTVESALNRLQATLRDWELSYVFRAPISGQVQLGGPRNERRYVSAGDAVGAVVAAAREDALVGRASASMDAAAKVRPGQDVLVRLAGYPSSEYGTVRGLVQTVSLVPRDDTYTVVIRLPQGLRTSYGQTLPLRQELSGTATILTDDVRLLDRVLFRARGLVATQ